MTETIIIIVIFAVFSQIMQLYCIKYAVKLANKPEETAEEPFFHIPKRKKEPKMTESDYRTNQILANIDNYDGSSKGQKKVKPMEK